VHDLYWLDNIRVSDRPWVGEKAFHLSQLAQQGYPVVGGFVLPAQMMREFLSNLNWLEPLFADLPDSSLHLNVHDFRQLQTIAQRMQQEILAADLPRHWVAALAAQIPQLQAPTLILRASLSVQSDISSNYAATTERWTDLWDAPICPPDVALVEAGLKQSWATLFRAKSLLCWTRLNLQLHHLHLAVLVQPMQTTIASGTLHATATSFEIQSTWGLGIALRRGEVVPDFYRVEAQTGALQSQQLGSKGFAYGSKPGGIENWVSTEMAEMNLPHTPPFLQTYLPSQGQQEQYVLSALELDALVQLAQSLRPSLGETFSLEWAFCQAAATAEPRFYLTKATPLAPLPPAVSPQPCPRPVTEADQRLLVQGIAAAGGQVVAKTQIVTDARGVLNLPPGVILVASTILLTWLPRLEKVAGIVTEQGGVTSHGAIVARELGIPAIVGAVNATQLLQSGEWVLLDGDRGAVYSASQADANAVVDKQHLTRPPQRFTDTPIATQLLVNLSQASALERVRHLPVEGVGLLRSELMLVRALDQQHPQLWLKQGRQSELVNLIAAQIRQFTQVFAPRPVFYRTLDIRSHEFQALAGGALSEANPMLGMRGTFSYMRDPALFDVELAAIVQVQQSGGDNLRVLLPFVRTVEEFIFCRERVAQSGLFRSPDFQLWIMAEVPSVIWLLPDYVKAGVQGISIGTNDLTQLILAADRDQGQMAATFEARHPAVMRAIEQLIQSAKQLGIPCSICGQAPVQYPDLIESFVRWGITSLSVEAEAVEQTYETIARVERKISLEVAEFVQS